MGKFKIALAAMAVAALATSCKDEYVTERYVTENHVTEYVIGADVKTFVYDVAPADWQRASNSEGRNYLYAEFDCKEIDKDVMDNGAVVGAVYYFYNPESQLASWNNLPYVMPYTTTDSGVIGENIRFEYEEGVLTFVIEDLDGKDPEEMVNDISFKVSIFRNGDDAEPADK